jgi:hypothetical protein
LVLLLIAVTGGAQELEPRSFVNLPVGQNFTALVYAYSEGELNAAPSVPLEDANVEIHSSVLGYVRSLDMWGNSGKIGVTVGAQCFDGAGLLDGMHVEASRCGTLDPRVTLAYNFYGAPAMDSQTFMRTRPGGLVMGVSMQIGVPLGKYHDDKLINSGANRWFFRPEVGFSNSWGPWSVDGSMSVKLFSDNDDFFGERTLAQDNIYQAQLHLIYSLPKGRWFSLNGNYFWGGKTEKDGLGSSDLQENSRFGATLSWPLNNRHSLKFLAHTALATTVGNDFETYGIAWQYRWGD